MVGFTISSCFTMWNDNTGFEDGKKGFQEVNLCQDKPDLHLIGLELLLLLRIALLNQQSFLAFCLSTLNNRVSDIKWLSVRQPQWYRFVCSSCAWAERKLLHGKNAFHFTYKITLTTVAQHFRRALLLFWKSFYNIWR